MIGRDPKIAHDWPLFHYGMAVGFTVMAAVGLYRFFIAGEETDFVWYQLCCIPWVIGWLANEIQRGVDRRLDLALCFAIAAIICVGAYRTETWLLIFSAAGVLVVLVWQVCRYLRARDGAPLRVGSQTPARARLIITKPWPPSC